MMIGVVRWNTKDDTLAGFRFYGVDELEDLDTGHVVEILSNWKPELLGDESASKVPEKECLVRVHSTDFACKDHPELTFPTYFAYYKGEGVEVELEEKPEEEFAE